MEEIYFAGGCLWGVQEFLRHLPGVIGTEAGRANGSSDSLDGDYDGYAECVKVQFDPKQISVRELLGYFLEIIDPYSLNAQGPDVGEKYRTGIYSLDSAHLQQANDFIAGRGDREKIVVEVLPLANFVRSAEKHQDRLMKNPDDSCHLPMELLHKYKVEPESKPSLQRWIVLFAGIILQTAIGGIYAWSTFVPALVQQHDLSRGQTGMIFGVQVLIFALTTVPAGKLLSRFGPRRTSASGALLFGLGYLLASFFGHSFPALLLCLGVVTGSGIGMVYVCPLTTGMKWFPRHKGLVTGAAVAGFGMGAIFLSQVAEYLLVARELSVLEVFRLVGIVFGGIAFLSALCLANPPSEQRRAIQRVSGKILTDLRSPVFRVLALGMFAGTFAGLLLSAHLKPFLLFQGGSESMAVLAISLFAVGNTLGRLVWGVLHDKTGSRQAVLMSLSCALLSFLLLSVLALLKTDFLAAPLIVLAGFGFGGCFVIYVSAITTVFGIDRMPRLYPICFIGYGLAALAGPSSGGWLVDQYGGYAPAFLLATALILIAMMGVLISSRTSWAPESPD